MSFVQQQQPKDRLLPDRQERRREAVVLNPSNVEESRFNGDGDCGGGGDGGDGIGGSRGRGNESFFDRLRAQLLRVRVARLLRQDFALGKQLAELKALCDEVSTELGTDVSQELWNVVSRQGRLSGPQGTVQGSSVTTASAAHLGQLQNSSLAQDAGLVSLARALLRRAAGVANNRPVRNGRSSHEWHSSRPPPPPSPPTPCNPWKGPPVLPPSFSFRGNNEGGGRSPAELPRHDVESRDDPLTRKSEDNLTITTPPAPPPAPLPTPPPTPPAPVATATGSIRSSPDAPPLLAGKGGSPNTVKASLNSVLAGKGAPAPAPAMVDAAKKTRFVQTGDRARTVDGIATWPRNEGGPSLQPKPHLSTPPSSSKRVDFHCHNGKGGALVIGEEPPRPPAGDDVGPRDETGGGGGGFSVKLSARGAQRVTVCLSQCPCRRFDGKQAVDTAAAAAARSIRHAVDGSRGVIDGDIDRALSPKLFTRPAESKGKRPSTLYRREEEMHHQERRRVPPVHPRPQISTHFCQTALPRPPPSPQALPVAGVAYSPQKNRSFGETLRGKIGSRQKPYPARRCTFGTGAKTTCEDARDVAPPISVLGPMGRGADLRSYTDDPRGGERRSYDDSHSCVQPSSVKFVARHNVCSPRIESDGGDTGRWPCCSRLGNGYQNEQYITGAQQCELGTANSSHTASPSGTTTTQKAAVHPAGYRRRYGRRDDSGETCQRYASGETKTEREPLQSADSNTDKRNREASPTRRRLPSAGSMESDTGTAGMAEVRNDESSSCALARKRALVRVRLARQRNNLAAAVADANERGFRAERRRRREERLAALLLKTFGGGVVDDSRHVERRPLSSQDDENDSEGGGGESGSSPTGVRCSRPHQKEINRPTKEVASAVPSVPWHSYQDTPPPPDGGGTPSPPDGGGTAPPPDGGGLRHYRPGSGGLRLPISPIVVVGKGREEEEAEVPRQPLKIIPVKPELPACSFRSAWCADNNERRLRGNTPRTSTQHSEALQDVDSHSSRARFSCIMSSPSPLVVFIDALRALPGRRSYFDGGVGWDGADGGRPSIWDEPCVDGSGGVFLVLEAGRLEHQTAVRLPAHAGIDFCRATTKREQEWEGGGNAWVADGRRRKIADREVSDDKWIFRETVVLQSTATVGDELALVENGLCVRVYARDKLLAHDDSSGVAAEKDHRLVGVATLPLRRLVVGGVLGEDSSKQACECTFSRPEEVSVLSLEGVAIGWLRLSICGAWGVLGGDYSGG